MMAVLKTFWRQFRCHHKYDTYTLGQEEEGTCRFCGHHYHFNERDAP